MDVCLPGIANEIAEWLSGREQSMIIEHLGHRSPKNLPAPKGIPRDLRIVVSNVRESRQSKQEIRRALHTWSQRHIDTRVWLDLGDHISDMPYKIGLRNRV